MITELQFAAKQRREPRATLRQAQGRPEPRSKDERWQALACPPSLVVDIAADQLWRGLAGARRIHQRAAAEGPHAK